MTLSQTTKILPFSLGKFKSVRSAKESNTIYALLSQANLRANLKYRINRRKLRKSGNSSNLRLQILNHSLNFQNLHQNFQSRKTDSKNNFNVKYFVNNTGRKVKRLWKNTRSASKETFFKKRQKITLLTRNYQDHNLTTVFKRLQHNPRLNLRNITFKRLRAIKKCSSTRGFTLREGLKFSVVFNKTPFFKKKTNRYAARLGFLNDEC